VAADGGENTAAGPQAPTPRERRSIIGKTVLRALATMTLLLVLYYILPMDTALDSRTVVILIVCLAAFGAIASWRVLGITRSEHPGLRAIETFAAVVPLYILVFAVTYFLAERSYGASFSEPLTRTDALYFSVTVLSTVGFGDITATSETARLIVTAQMFLDLIVLGLGARVFLGAVKMGRKRHVPRQPE
jgi:voltage-gated potassium channel